jgi:ATP-binding cassette subfamily B protein
MKQNNPPMKRRFNGAVLKRLLKMLFGYYPVLLPVSIVCIVFSAITAAIPAIFLKEVTNAITTAVDNGVAWEIAKNDIIPKVLILVGFYVLSIIAVTLETQLMAGITQSFLSKMRKTLFEGMQDLPIKYFDTHKHGDIMSHYTNDIDTLRQLVGQSIPTLIRAGVIVLSVFFIMLYYSLYLTLILLLGVVLMIFVTKIFGGNSAHFFIRLQQSVGKLEGFAQEMMNGQKVVKVFCHE